MISIRDHAIGFRFSTTGLCLLMLVAVYRPEPTQAHADLMLLIEDLNREIAKAPNNPENYLRRGQLFREHSDYELAYADIERAAALSPPPANIDLYRGRLFLDWGWPLTSRACLDRFLTRQPRNADGLVLRARALAKLNQRLAATQDYDRAIALSPEAGPDMFVERAQMLVAEGPEYIAEAVKGLDDGIQKLGPLVTLQLFAIDAELKRGNFDGALARVDKVAERSPRKETWLSRRAEILVQAGRPDEAKRSYEAALAALQTLPPTRRNVPAMQELARHIRSEIDSLGGKNSAAPGGSVVPPKP